MKSGLWIATSGIPLNKDLRYDAAEVMDLLLGVSDRTTIRRHYDQMGEAFSCLLANLNNAEALNRAKLLIIRIVGFQLSVVDRKADTRISK